MGEQIRKFPKLKME